MVCSFLSTDREKGERQDFELNTRPDGSRASGQLHRLPAARTTRRSGLGDLPVRAIDSTTAVKTPPDPQMVFTGTAGAIGDLAGFLDVLRFCADEIGRASCRERV